MPASAGGCSRGGRVDYTIGKGVRPASSPWPRWTIRIRERMDLKMGEGPYFTFFRPYHLTSLEVPLTCARVVPVRQGRHGADGPAGGGSAPSPKRDLAPGEGRSIRSASSCYRARIMTVEEGGGGPGDPLWPAGRATVTAPIKKGAHHAGQCRGAGRQPDHRPGARQDAMLDAMPDAMPDAIPGAARRNSSGREGVAGRCRDDDEAGQPAFAIRRYSPSDLRAALKKIWLIRRFEEGAEDNMRGMIHGRCISASAEASAVATCMELTDADKITLDPSRPRPLHRQGAEVRRMFAEFFGREDGYCHGRGGSMQSSRT